MFLFSISSWAQERIEVITLGHRSAEQMIPLIQPLVGKDGAVTGLQNRLIIRTTPDKLAQIKKVIASLDSKPRRLLITVRQNVTREALADEASVYGRVGTDNVRARIPRQHGDAAAQVELGSRRNNVGAQINSTRDIERGSDTQTVQVLEGNAAFISVGQTVPLQSRTVIRGGRSTTVVEETQYRDVTSGFQVLPRVNGDVVTLEINPQRSTLSSQGSIDVQQASTVISGRLGEWLELGGAGQQTNSSGSGVVYSTRDVRADNRSIFVKVEELP